jgi:hypothetical protein
MKHSFTASQEWLHLRIGNERREGRRRVCRRPAVQS